MTKVHLHLICPSRAEEKLLDVLLISAGDQVFTSVHVFEHGIASESLNAEEQVMGRRRAVHLQLCLDEDAATSILESIQRELRGSGLRYWATPVAFEGEIK
ncbi:DUF3240 family protein [Variovorax sp. RHLX14]|uniref:DUF3240 family protein n=1 Tax=Variovorax sp. RHLX14 TaxID=1259731 RepID=UPI003F461381